MSFFEDFTFKEKLSPDKNRRNLLFTLFFYYKVGDIMITVQRDTNEVDYTFLQAPIENLFEYLNQL